jgi:hypothetical protein
MSIDDKCKDAPKGAERKTTYIDIYSCDQGHYGSRSCGHCSTSLPDDVYDKCPKCDYEFTGTKHSYDVGGSDF